MEKVSPRAEYYRKIFAIEACCKRGIPEETAAELLECDLEEVFAMYHLMQKLEEEGL